MQSPSYEKVYASSFAFLHSKSALSRLVSILLYKSTSVESKLRLYFPEGKVSEAARHSNCGKPLKLLIPLYDGDIRIRTPGKLGKTSRLKFSKPRWGMVKTQKIRYYNTLQRVVISKMGNPQRRFCSVINKMQNNVQRLNVCRVCV